MADGAPVFVVGSINTDLVAYVERLPAPGETLFGERFAQFAGGKGANQAVARPAPAPRSPFTAPSATTPSGTPDAPACARTE